jgi:hypothetical protein
MASPSNADSRHTHRPPATVFESLAQLQPVGERPNLECFSNDDLLVSVKDIVAQMPSEMQKAVGEKNRIPALYVSANGGTQLWGTAGTLYQEGVLPMPPNLEFVGTLLMSDTAGEVPVRVYHHEEQNTIFSIIHEANMHALEAELRNGGPYINGRKGSLMDYTAFKTRGASLLPSFLRSALDPYYLVREGVAPILAMRAPESTKELGGSVLDKGSAAAFAEKMKASPSSKFVTVFTKSCAAPPTFQAKLTMQEAKAAGDQIVGALAMAIVNCKLKECETEAELGSEAETSILTPSPPRWQDRPVRHTSVRVARARIQVAHTLYGKKVVNDKELCLFTNMFDVARAISKELMLNSDDLLLGRFLAERFRNSAGMSMKAEMLQAIAEALDSKCSLAFVTLAMGGGGELAPPLLLAHGGQVVETTAEHLARMLEGGHTAVIKFSHMENRVRQVAMQGVTRGQLRLSESFRTSMTASLIHDSRMEVVARPPVEDASGYPAPIKRVAEGKEMDASLFQLGMKRQRVEERVAREGGGPSYRSFERPPVAPGAFV